MRTAKNIARTTGRYYRRALLGLWHFASSAPIAAGGLRFVERGARVALALAILLALTVVTVVVGAVVAYVIYFVAALAIGIAILVGLIYGLSLFSSGSRPAPKPALVDVGLGHEFPGDLPVNRAAVRR